MESTKRIRKHETTLENAHRVPVFAVSASLQEKDIQMYIDLGFDGWIMKPVNFDRLNTLLAGICDHEARNNAVYEPGQWEKGGWFTPHTTS